MAIKPIRVSQLNGYIKRVLQTDPLLGNVSVIGEVSNLKFHSSGHVYFTLKDELSKLNCFLPSEQFKKLHYELAEGMEITILGYINVYERGGTYSLNVRNIIVEGMGNLAIAFEKLKSKLEKEGLFDIKYKKSIPPFPHQIAIITSETGAAVRDIIKIITGMNNIIKIIVYPCLVQGPDAATDISLAITDVNRLFPETDIIIVGRGGGSIEELWPFNEEIVARSIFLSEIPVISAVGHETDFTIADYVADKRAATPSEAAQIAVPDIRVLTQSVKFMGQDLIKTMGDIIRFRELEINRYNMITLRNQLFDRYKLYTMKSNNLIIQLIHEIKNILFMKESKIELLKGELNRSNPLEIMNRGYGAILNKEGRLATGVEPFKPGDFLTVIFKDGKIKCTVDEIWRNPNEEK